MLTEQFYDILDKELEQIIAEKPQWIAERKLNQPYQQKSYALLIWFLQFYAPNRNRFQQAITEGLDDSSCDIIFSQKNNGEEIFYVVQSKWNKKQQTKSNQQEAKIDADEVKKAIVDFQSILKKDKPVGKNELFNEKWTALQVHLSKDTGKVKFIFLGLLAHNPDLQEHITNFEKQNAPHIKFEIIDIERLKRDYIEFKYKEIKVKNPLQYEYYQPEAEKITIPIERVTDAMGKGDHFKVDKPYEAYIFRLKPKTIYELFEKYEFSLFFSNIRNPLPASNYNAAIVDTLRNKPEMFWYFNNGITAISNYIYEPGIRSEEISMLGLQIINGAQTVYSIYAAYRDANNVQRVIMNEETRISFRIIKSANKDMNLQITRYTNAQNPVESRDFWANDPIQLSLQEESFETKYWYEKRRGEFRNVPEGGVVLENDELGRLYLQFWLQKGYLYETPFFDEQGDENLVFISENDKPDGLYETIFHDSNMRFEKLLSVYLLRETYIKYFKQIELRMSLLTTKHNEKGIIQPNNLDFFILSKTIIETYLTLKYGNDIKTLDKIIIKLCKEKNDIILRLFIFTRDSFNEIVTNYQNEGNDRVFSRFYKQTFSTEDIENIDISAYQNPSS